MIDVKWNDNAKAAVEYFAEWAKLSDNGVLDVFMQGINAEAQTKTVADAVEWHKKAFGNLKWNHDSCDIIAHEQGWLFLTQESALTESDNNAEVVCTREQFEAYVKEQEGEKWTHTYGEHKCYIKIDEPDLEGYIVVVTEFNGYIPCKPENLKPIKPTMKKGEQEAVARFIARIWSKRNPDLRAEFDAFCDDHEII